MLASYYLTSMFREVRVTGCFTIPRFFRNKYEEGFFKYFFLIFFFASLLNKTKNSYQYLKVSHAEDFFAPLDEKGSTHIQVEVGETFSFSLWKVQTQRIVTTHLYPEVFAATPRDKSGGITVLRSFSEQRT